MTDTTTSPATSPDRTGDHHVTWVSVDDWNAIYVDGTLIGEQGHSLSPWTWIEVLQALGADVTDLRHSDIAEQVIEAHGRFPATWPPAPDTGTPS